MKETELVKGIDIFNHKDLEEALECSWIPAKTKEILCIGDQVLLYSNGKLEHLCANELGRASWVSEPWYPYFN